MCDDKTWYDTGLRLPENLCCDHETGIDDPTYKPCSEFEDNEIE
jgi:hypothetical protein